MDNLQFFSLMGTFLACFGFLYKELKGIESDLKTDLKAQAGRTDQLYTMFIDLLKAK